MALYIARHKEARMAQLADSLVNVPLIVPTTALGYSLALFWGGQDIITNVTVLVIFAHIAFTYPLVVRNVAGAVMEVDPSYEEAARTLGAKPFATFRTVLFPIVRSSVLAGAILAFTRSLGETGATFAVNPDANTMPVYIVNLVESGDFYLAAIAAMVLIMVSFVFMFGIHYIVKGEGGRR
ncbi:MAG TPA: ABC transporter permease subunit [Candidatus Methanomethylophilaceae archaeon]|nr:ABC transporter permease subunit [Candidatus Methanomethylophilaceae archaeon]